MKSENVKKWLKALSLIGKLASVLELLPGINVVGPQGATVLFMLSSLLKDSVNRIGDYIDDGKMNNSYKG